MELKEFTGQHKNSVGRVFKRMGWANTQVTPKDVLLAIALHKDDFINEVADQIEADHVNGISQREELPWAETEYYNWGFASNPVLQDAITYANNQDNPTGKLAEVKNLPEVVITAKKKSNKARGILSDILGAIGGGLGAYAASRHQGGGNTQQQAPPPAPKKMNMFFIIGAVLIVVLAVLIFSKKKK